MRLGSKHANQSTQEIYDFSGGLNTSCVEEQIATNQLATCVNFDIETTSGLLKTAYGTAQIMRLGDVSYSLKAGAYDALNKRIVLFANDKTVLSAPLTDLTSFSVIGTLTGDLVPICVVWEDGLIVASGGKLQYIKGTTMETIDASPDVCKGAYTKSGRIITFDDDNIRYSGVGDETNWTEDTNSASDSIWVEAGYKVGGKMLGMVNMSSDILMIKDNGRLLRLNGDYPDWEITEVARNVDCNSGSSFCNVVNDVYIFGGGTIQKVVTTQEYGDMRATNIANNIAKDLEQIPKADSKLRYLPALNQIWIIDGTTDVFLFDLNVNAFYMRRFNAPVSDAFCISTDTYVVKLNGLDIIDAFSYTDDGKYLEYDVRFKTDLSHYDYFVKRLTWACTGYGEDFNNVMLSLGGVIKVPCPIRGINSKMTVYNNFQTVYHNVDYRMTKINWYQRKIIRYANRGKIVYSDDDFVYGNLDYIVNIDYFVVNDQKIRYRMKDRWFRIAGKACQFVLNKIKFDVVEV